MTTGRDGAGHVYEEFEKSENEQIRVTLVPFQKWADGPTLRIQKRAYTGRVSQGPKLPISKGDELIEAVRSLMKAAGSAGN
jgi:hypothetical protein